MSARLRPFLFSETGLGLKPILLVLVLEKLDTPIFDPIFILRQVQEKILEGNRKRYWTFVDLEKAFDRVPREVLSNQIKSNQIYLTKGPQVHLHCNTSNIQ